MDIKENAKELFVVVLAAVILALAVSFTNTPLLLITIVYFLIIIGSNVLTKKAVGYLFETKVQIKFWSWYQWGFRKDSHFKKPVPMAWLPLILALFTKGIFWWFAILEFDVAAKTERVSKRHGLYRFTEVTEKHIGMIATWGIVVNFILAIIGYLVGFEMFAKLSIFYIAWSIIPLSSLDGSKILFSNRGLWIALFAIIIIALSWGFIVL